MKAQRREEYLQRIPIEANQADIRAEVSNFCSYIAGGELHTILIKSEFYGYQVDGTSVRDWVAALAYGELVSDVKYSIDRLAGDLVNSVPVSNYHSHLL